MRIYQNYIIILFLLLMSACSLTKSVPQGSYLVHKVDVITDKAIIKKNELVPYIKQTPPHKTFGLIPFPLYLYNWAGNDSTRWINRFLHRVGTAPEIYSETQTYRTEREMEKMLINKGYMQAEVKAKETFTGKKVKIEYFVEPGTPKIIGSINYQIPDSAVASYIYQDTAQSVIKVDALLDRSVMDEERSRITNTLRNNGYWAFNKDNINYLADTSRYSSDVGLTLRIPDNELAEKAFTIGQVYFHTNYNPMMDEQELAIKPDTVDYEQCKVINRGERYIRESTLWENNFIIPGALYSDKAVDITYGAFSRLQILKNVIIRFENPDTLLQTVDCHILLTPGHNQNLQTEIEGTNSDGDLGFAASVTYQHYNIFKGSETLTTEVRGGYENISSNVENIVQNNYMELGLKAEISFPKFLFPFLSAERKRKFRATTGFAASYNYQHRPEYTRVIAGGSWNYKWVDRRDMSRHRLDFIDVNYVYLPYRSESFIDSIISQNPVTYASYKDHLITRTGYNYYKSNLNPSIRNRDVYTLRVNTEIAGNILAGIARLADFKKVDNDYTLFGLRFEQYWKLDLEYAYTKVFTPKNSIAFRVAGGVAVPYGNSDVMPFEKRYYSGGANSVRGWSVRTLGPGIYHSDNSNLDYFNQCGDIRFDANVEYRTKLFWKLEMAAFVDAGNVWTIRDYPGQKGGLFEFNEFYKQIALAWGLGVRLDFDFFLLRLDLGFKAFDPSKSGDLRWAIKKPLARGNQTLHFAIGYPF